MYRVTITDEALAPATTYKGYSSYQGVATSDKEWAVLRITVAGTTTTEEWAGVKGDDDISPQAFAWDDRATLTYG